MCKTCQVERFGLVPYLDAWKLQDQWAQEISAGQRSPTLMLLEHPHTYTFGRRGNLENLLWDESRLTHNGVEVHWVDRGGDVTYHGPGQLVCYPLLPLVPVSFAGGPQNSASPRIPQVDYVGYVRKLERVLVLALARLGVAGSQREGLTGVWVQPHNSFPRTSTPLELRQLPAKIASIGVKVDARGVSRHGFALNVDPDMSYWQGIVGCGLKDAPIASLADYLHAPLAITHVMDCVAQAFGEIFDYEMVENPEGHV